MLTTKILHSLRYDCIFVNLESSEEIKHACLRCDERGHILQLTLKFSSENAACEALAHDKVMLSLSLTNDTIVVISCVCALDRPVDKI